MLRTLPLSQCIFKPGDLLAFGGEGIVSRIIERFTASPVSHVAMVLSRDTLIEATTLDGHAGVSIGLIRDRLAAYAGNVWHLPLSDACRAKLDTTQLAASAQIWNGQRYDMQGVIDFGWRRLLPFLHVTPAPGHVFCSELWVLMSQRAGGYPAGIDAREVSPAELCAMPLFQPDYFQIVLARQTAIPGFQGSGQTLQRLAA